MQLRGLKRILISGLTCVFFLSGGGSAQSDQDSLFSSAVQLYQQNQFRGALDKFKQVNGSHAAEAKAYVGKINTYVEAWSAATTVLQRSSDERDARSLDYAIQELQIAMSIKADGPGHPDQQLARARQMKLDLQQGTSSGLKKPNANSDTSKDGDASLCDRAVAAAAQHDYKQASKLSCMLANENPAYSCGGNEAVYLCHLNTDLVKDLSTTDQPKKPVAVQQSAPVTPALKPMAVANGDFEKAKAAYDKNDFERARALFEKVNGDAKSAAGEYLDKISHYSNSVSSGEKLSRDGKYADAQAAFLNAAGIKLDGPGNPQGRAGAMELLLALDQFYSGDYASATQHLEACAKANAGKPALVHFYLGASKLGQFLLTGSEDDVLHQDALNELKQAKQDGFKPTSDVSPKILDAYKGL